MTYKIVVLKERVSFLVEELGKNITAGEDWSDDMVTVELNVNYNTDIIDIFHAGVRYGMKMMMEKTS